MNHHDIPTNWPRPDMGELVEPAPERKLSWRSAIAVMTGLIFALWLAVWAVVAAAICGAE